MKTEKMIRSRMSREEWKNFVGLSITQNIKRSDLLRHLLQFYIDNNDEDVLEYKDVIDKKEKQTKKQVQKVHKELVEDDMEMLDGVEKDVVEDREYDDDLDLL